MMRLISDNHGHHLADDKHALSWAWYDDIDDGKHALLDVVVGDTLVFSLNEYFIELNQAK